MYMRVGNRLHFYNFIAGRRIDFTEGDRERRVKLVNHNGLEREERT